MRIFSPAMRRLSLVFGGVALLGLWYGTTAAWTQDSGNTSDFMRLKLEHSQKVLEGLALEDFQLIAKHSQEISLLSQAANWRVLQTPEYLQQSLEFRRTADGLTEAAKAKNLEGAALKYVDLTMKCVHCHKYVRGVRLARVD